MATDTIERLLTVDEFVELAEAAPPDVTLELIDGQLRERPMTSRGPRHSEAIIRIGQVLANWLDTRPEIAAVVVGGEARCRISTDPDTIIGLDVAYFRGPQHANLPDGAKLYDGTPFLAVEVLSDIDTHESIIARVRLLLSAGVPQVWVADADSGPSPSTSRIRTQSCSLPANRSKAGRTCRAFGLKWQRCSAQCVARSFVSHADFAVLISGFSSGLRAELSHLHFPCISVYFVVPFSWVAAVARWDLYVFVVTPLLVGLEFGRQH